MNNTSTVSAISIPYDSRLEKISDDIRKGIPVGFFEALEAIEYQKTINEAKRKPSFLKRFISIFNFNNAPKRTDEF